jgi:NAD(P)-dependent dehydrogenase (short-subunit alcohol dehydrogenase family)
VAAFTHYPSSVRRYIGHAKVHDPLALAILEALESISMHYSPPRSRSDLQNSPTCQAALILEATMLLTVVLAAQTRGICLCCWQVTRQMETLATLQSEMDVASCDTVEFLQHDLSPCLSLVREVEALAAEMIKRHQRLDAIVHCAGLVLRKRMVTAEGIEAVLAVQFVARFHLNEILLPLLRASPSPRVVNVSAGGGNLIEGTR